MTTSPRTPVQLAVEGDGPIPAGVMAYLSSRARGHWFDYIHDKLRQAEDQGLTRKALAERIGKSPTRLSHILSNPGNWTIDTVAELLIGIAREEVIPRSEPLLGKPPRNHRHEDELFGETPPARAEVQWKEPQPYNRLRAQPKENWTVEERESQNV